LGQLERAAHEAHILLRLCLALVRGAPLDRHSHSMVAGGLPETSYTTPVMPRTSLMIRLETLTAARTGARPIAPS
jgi:hypothetical protein